MIGLAWLLVMFGVLAYAVREYLAAERRYAAHERVRSEWLADPADVEKYQRFLRSSR